MKKRFLYQFSGTVLVQAKSKAESEKAITGIPLDYFLIDEEVYEVDEYYVANDRKIRKVQIGTALHPVIQSDEFEAFKIRECRYNRIFTEFLHGKFDKDELIKRIDEAEANDELLDDCNLFSEISMIDIDAKKPKMVRHFNVD